MSYKTLSLLACTVIVVSFAGGCSSPSSGSNAVHRVKESKVSQSEQKIDELAVKAFASRGYDSGIEYATENAKLSPSIGNGPIEVSIMQPRRQGKYPLVLYMPGLGESSDAAKNIRNAWATSGYVVIAFQPLQDDITIMSTAAAKEGDFAYIRHDRFSPEVVSSRLNALSKFIEYLKHAVISGDTSFNNIDLDHVAIVGFDLGARSAMIAAGEEVPSITNPGMSLKVASVIALSPYADFSGSAFNSRYQKINLPVLSITGDADDDTRGAVPITLHQAPFQYMPEGNKYLLLLAGASHAVIGDSVQTYEVSAPDRGEGTQSPENGSSNKSSGRGRGGRNGKKSSGSDSNNSPMPAKRPPAGPTQRAMMEVAIAQISTAFLNAHVKNDNLAKDWLRNYSQPWLYNIGQLKEK